jgi:hypothetical protein
MRLYIFQGLKNERAPKDATHVIVDDSVVVIRKDAFFECRNIVSIIMGDNVKRIERQVFMCCTALRFIRLSRTLNYIGHFAFCQCKSLEALFLPSTVKTIREGVFAFCRSLRLLILPNDINLSNLGSRIIKHTAISQMSKDAGVPYECYDRYDESNLRVNKWLKHHMDEAPPFHKMCCDPFVGAQKVNDCRNENGNDCSAIVIDTVHGVSPLHILAMNPHAPADAFAALINDNMEAIFCLDNMQPISIDLIDIMYPSKEDKIPIAKEKRTPLDFARENNVGGLIAMISILCNHRNSSVPFHVDTKNENVTKRRRIGN